MALQRSAWVSGPRWSPRQTSWMDPLESAETVPEARESGEGWRLWTTGQKWRAVELLYDLVNPGSASDFVRQRGYLVDLLLEAYARLWLCFGDWPVVELELEGDPEVLRRRYLAARILTSLSPEEAVARLERFDEEWWLDHIGRAGRDLVFVPEFG